MPNVPLDSQVGGHPGILSDASGDLVIKPLLPVEHAFYSLLEAEDDHLAPLIGLTPRFMGVLELQGKLEEGEEKQLDQTDVGRLLQGKEIDGVKPVESSAQEPKKHIVLSNAASKFKRPSILDVKLGTVLYDEDATEEKKARMAQRALDTTSGTTGIRLTGFQNWDSTTQTVIATQKDYGRSLEPSGLPSGIARFLPLASQSTPHGLPAHLLESVLDWLIAQTWVILSALEETEARFVGMSLLVMYETSVPDLERSLEDTSIDSDLCATDEGSSDEDEWSADEGAEQESRPKRPQRNKPTSIKLIDFAHSRPAPGQGPDEGVLLGVKTFLCLLEGRRQEVLKST